MGPVRKPVNQPQRWSRRNTTVTHKMKGRESVKVRDTGMLDGIEPMGPVDFPKPIFGHHIIAFQAR
jgi:hypothetical protein